MPLYSTLENEAAGLGVCDNRVGIRCLRASSELTPRRQRFSPSFSNIPKLINAVRLIILLALIAANGAARIYAQSNTAPLSLFIKGGGSVSPLTNGQLLQVGETYNMVAIPAAGFAFNSWQPVNVVSVTNVVIDAANGNTSTNVSVVVYPVPAYTNQPSLDFIMQPVDVIYNTPGGTTMTRTSGWQANFDPVAVTIQFSESEVILTWTNSSYYLQAAPALRGGFTNISGAVSPYTNKISAPARYFRLISNQ